MNIKNLFKLKGGDPPKGKEKETQRVADEKETASQQRYLLDYMDSPGYTQRLQSEVGSNAASVLEKRKAQLAQGYGTVENIAAGQETATGMYLNNNYPASDYEKDRESFSPEAQAYLKPGQVIVKTPFLRTEQDDYTTTPIHEFTHQATQGTLGMSAAAREKIKKVADQSKFVKADSYLKDPTEIHARLGALRYLMDVEGIYDSKSGKPFTKEDLEKVKQNKAILRDANGYDIQQIYLGKDEELIEHLNTIASKKSTPNFTVPFNQHRYGTTS